VGWSQDVGRQQPPILRSCIECLLNDGQVMAEACRDTEHRQSVVQVKCVSSWLCLLRNYVTMMNGQQNIKSINSIRRVLTLLPADKKPRFFVYFY
jgi:hypothetical protein